MRLFIYQIRITNDINIYGFTEKQRGLQKLKRILEKECISDGRDLESRH